MGLLGRTGSGKTTLTRLLLRLYDPAAGPSSWAESTYGACPLTLCAGSGLVTQDVQLFRATVRDNLTLFDRSVPDASVLGALDAWGWSPWLARLPRGLDTPLGPGGEGLSAGEAQLLAFGRVFLRDPRVVILDEASSRLDPATERFICRGHRPAPGGADGHRRRPPPGDGAAGGRRPRPGGGPGGRVGPPRRAWPPTPGRASPPSCGALRQGGGAGVTGATRRAGASTDTAGVVVRLIAYSPWRFGLAVASSILVFGLPVATGLTVKRFFDTLSGSAPAGPGIWTVIALFGAVGVAEMLSNATLSYGWITFLHRSMALLRRNVLAGLVFSPTAHTVGEAPGAALNRIMGDSRRWWSRSTPGSTWWGAPCSWSER